MCSLVRTTGSRFDGYLLLQDLDDIAVVVGPGTKPGGSLVGLQDAPVERRLAERLFDDVGDLLHVVGVPLNYRLEAQILVRNVDRQDSTRVQVAEVELERFPREQM